MTYEEHYDEANPEILIGIKGIKEDGTILYIPIHEGNMDYQAYLAAQSQEV